MKCPECDIEATQVGAFWVCPDHGPLPVAKPFVSLNVFLSYGHDANEQLVRRIKADLESRGHNVWFDQSEIKAGDDWRRKITDGIARSNKFVSFLSKHSTRDPGVCRDEIAIAIGVMGGNIQTILVESEDEVKPPVNIGHIQWLDMKDWKTGHGTVHATDDQEGNELAVGDETWEKWYQTKLAEIVRVVESEESRRFAGEIEDLNRHLKPIRSEARISHLLSKGFFGRQWLFDAVEQWRQHSEDSSRLFWIMGAPGVGKSAFAAQLTHTRGDVVIGAQFCEWDKPDHRDARRVVCSIAFQLATRLPDYRKLLTSLPEIEHLEAKGESELFDYLLANPLRTVIHGGRERYLIMIDALDETAESGRNPLVEMLARNAQRLPHWLGIVVTSRPEFDVRSPLQALNPHEFDTSSESNRADIRDYLRHHLGTKLSERSDADCLVEKILDKSEGVFLYIEHFCEDVKRGNLLLDRPDQFPQGLGGIYVQYFKRQFPDLEKFQNDVRPALRAILAAREPLPVEILQGLFHWQDEELRDFTRPLGSLFPVTKGSEHEVIKPYHKSLADWLTDGVKAGVYFVSRVEGHRVLAECFVDSWRKDRTGLSEVVYHLAEAGRFQAAATLLFNAEFQETKARQLGRATLSSDFLTAETKSLGFFGLAGVGCELLHFAKAESEGVRPLSGQYPNYSSSEHAPNLREYVSSYETLFAQACQKAQQWAREQTSVKHCAAFCRAALLMFAEDLAVVSKAAKALGEPGVFDSPQKLLLVQREVADALAHAKAAPRIPYNGPSRLGCDTARVALDYVERALRAADAALQLNPLHTLRELWEARRCQAIASCDGDPLGAIPMALDDAYEALQTRFTFLLKSTLTE